MIKWSKIYSLILNLKASLRNLIEKTINFIIHLRIKNDRTDFSEHGHALILFLQSIVFNRQCMNTNFFPNVFNRWLIACALHIFYHLQISLIFYLWAINIIPSATQRYCFISIFKSGWCENCIALNYFNFLARNRSGNLPAL